MSTLELDPVLVEVVGSALSTIVEEMSETLVKAAYSPNIKERRDCTASLFDAEGQAIAQDEGGSPLHLGSLMGIVASLRERYALEDIRPGDIFIGNDPYTGGGSHLPDIVLATPIFVEGVLTAWAATLAHHADFGDRGHAHIFQEAIRIPPVHLVREGVRQEELLQLILLNCQVPEERIADLRAQESALRVAVTRFGELCAQYGHDLVRAIAAELLDYTERRTRAAIAEFPDGEYVFEDRFDCPELDDELTLRVRIRRDRRRDAVRLRGQPSPGPRERERRVDRPVRGRLLHDQDAHRRRHRSERRALPARDDRGAGELDRRTARRRPR